MDNDFYTLYDEAEIVGEASFIVGQAWAAQSRNTKESAQLRRIYEYLLNRHTIALAFANLKTGTSSPTGWARFLRHRGELKFELI